MKKSSSQHANSAGKRTLATFTVAAALCIVAVCLLTVFVDPFFHYHAPLSGFPYIVDNQLSQNPGMARQMTYDSCIIGSSMTVNFHTDDFAQYMDLDTLKLSCSGALPHDDYRMLEIVYDASSPARQREEVKAVFLAVDPMTFTAGTEDTKYPWQEYLCDANPFNDISYLLNKDVLLQYILRPMIQGEGTNLSEVYESWWTPEYYNEQLVLEGYTPAEAGLEEMAADGLLAGTQANLEENILPFIEQHPETTFYLFFPPYSILYWNDVLLENHLEATMTQLQFIMERTLSYENVRVFYFQDMEELITDLNNYADYTHYKPEVNAYMVTCFADGEHEVTRDNMDDVLAHMRQIIDDYDFEGLREMVAFTVGE